MLKRAPDAATPRRSLQAIAATNLDTVVGKVQWDGANLPPFAAKNVAKTPLVGGQWRLKDGNKYDLVIIDNRTAPEIPVGGKMEAIACIALARFDVLMLLEVAGLRKSFGALVVADDLDLAIAPGEALGIIGPNGAGKTTLFNLITGDLSPDGGTISLRRPRRHRHAAAWTLPRRHRPLLPDPAAVREPDRVREPAGRRGPRPPASASARSRQSCGEILERRGLLQRANTLAGTLTLLERKRLELARALATAPRLLLLDEIAGGLTEGECGELVATIRDITRAGVTIVWIEHVVHALLAVVDRLVVLNFGRKIAEGEPRAVMASAEVREIYLGHRRRDAGRCSRPATSPPSTATSRRCSASTSRSTKARPSPSSARTGPASRPS